jgi:DivIVA domain-containing protein
VVTALAVLGVLLVLFVAAVLATRESPLLADVPPDEHALTLPDRPLEPDDVRALRFPMAPRGYRMAHVDAALDRLRQELADRDRRIALLEAAAEGTAPPAQARVATPEDLPVAPEPLGQPAAPEPTPPPAARPTPPPVEPWAAQPARQPVAGRPATWSGSAPPGAPAAGPGPAAVPPLPPVAAQPAAPPAAQPSAELPPELPADLPAPDLGTELLSEPPPAAQQPPAAWDTDEASQERPQPER